MNRFHSLCVLVAACTLPASLYAHTGADAGAHHGAAFVAGFFHPLVGIDHLVAMLAVGVLGVLMARRWWLAPVTFCTALFAGSLMGLAGFSVEWAEPMIALSVLVLGALIAMRGSLPMSAILVLIGGFALFHGAAHGQAFAQVMVAPWFAVAGMLAATLVLHVAGIFAGRALLGRNRWWHRAAGIGASGVGGFLLLQFL
jgi:urease accessory protein